MAVIEAGLFACDEQVLHFGVEFERIAGGDDEICDLAGFDGPEVFLHAEHLP